MIQYLRTDPLGLIGGYWAIRLCVDLLLSEAQERLRA